MSTTDLSRAAPPGSAQHLPHAGQAGGGLRGGWAALVATAMIVALFVGWIGYMASDDSLYHAGAVR